MTKAEEYSFLIESSLFQQLAKEQQALWRKEIEQAYNAGTEWADKAMIEKACNWLNDFYNEERHCYLVAEDIEAFIKAMEE